MRLKHWLRQFVVPATGDRQETENQSEWSGGAAALRCVGVLWATNLFGLNANTILFSVREFIKKVLFSEDQQVLFLFFSFLNFDTTHL